MKAKKKVVLQAKRDKCGQARSARETTALNIRMHNLAIEGLKLEAKEKGITVTALVREVLEEHQLRGVKLEETRLSLQELREEVRKLRRNVAVSTKLILVYVGQIPKEEADEWVSNHFDVEF